MKIDYLNLEFIDLNLRKMFHDLEEFMEGEPVITSLYRIGDNGVHGQLPLRGGDARCHNPEYGRICENHINDLWTYDPARPGMKACIFHDVGQGAHLHLQVHPNTVRND